MNRLAGGLATAVVALLLGGCAAMGAPEPAATPVATAASAPQGAPPLQVTVQAPRPLKALLERHLDVIRLGELARGERLEPSELDRLVAAAPAQARELLETEGYFDPEVQIEREGDRLQMNVKPGAQAVIGRLTIEVQGAVAEAAEAGDARARALIDSLRQGWLLPSGSPFRNAAWSSAKTDLLARLRSAGYAAASWSGTAAVVETETRQVRVFVVADSGPLFRAGGLDIQGLVHHDAETVQHLAGFGAGVPLTETLLLDFQDRLRRSALFDTVAVSFDPDPDQAAAAPVQVRLRESPRQVFTVGVGISANTGPRASLEHLHRRPFGWAAIARNKLEVGGLRQAWDGEISTHPLEKQYRWLLGGAVERLESDDDVVTAQRLRLGRAQNTPRIDRLAFVEAERSTRHLLDPAAPVPDTRELAVTANYQGVWRHLDDLLLPTRGYTLSLQGGVGRATSDPGGSGFFSRLYGRLTGYLPLGGDWYGQARVELGQVLRPDAVRVPDSQQFRAGGDDSVRGYGYRSLGPIVDGAVGSGDALFTTSVEVARPIVPRLPSVWGAVFVDAGRAAESFGDLKPAVGAGVGVRWRSPVGPLRLDLAWGEETRQFRLHFSVGISF
jgi:translocation and assembly module TamA